MKKLSLLFGFFILGFMAMILYKKHIVASQVSKVESPLAKTKGFSLDTPPAASLKGKILSMSGSLEWQSRSATEPAKLTKIAPVLQGEEFWTKENGSFHVFFPNAVDIALKPKTHVNFIQTLPTNFVISQDRGEVTYKKLGTVPMGIRILRLLVNQTSGTVDIAIDDEQSIILLNVLKGSITVAFNDSDNLSNVVTIDKGSTYRFNNEERTGKTITSE